MDEMIQILKGFYCMNFAEMPLRIHGQQIWNSAAGALYQSLFYVIYVYVIFTERPYEARLLAWLNV